MNQQALLKHYRLTQTEYQLISKYLNRQPCRLELALFSALWSEHCSYKSSSAHLKKLFFNSKKVVVSPGENAGVVDLGQGERVAFKIESHNHPSQIFPYHGAATGVGGILRDVFVMNAKPIALANYLCFGEPNHKGVANLVDGVIQGIGGYGNSIGVPTITGQTEFHPSYNHNTIVNAFALGYFGPEDQIICSKASGGEEHLLVYVGARTGRDGIHGASMASESFSPPAGAGRPKPQDDPLKGAEKAEVEDKKSSVQIGDPFYGWLLMSACLEVMRQNWVLASQDMGAAGLISSSFEMISKGEGGMDMFLDRVPLRDPTMTAEEILLSESQERALLLLKASNYPHVEQVFKKWGLPVQAIAKLTPQRQVQLFWKDKCLVCIDPELLTKKAPCYHRPYKVWRAKHLTSDVQKTTTLCPKGLLGKTLCSLLQDIRGTDRSFIYKQYDQRVGARTVRDSSSSVAVLRLPAGGRALGLCMGGRPHIMRMDSSEGGKDSVLRPALQLASLGFTPLALTDGLNFGSPEKKEIMSSFVACVQGMAEVSKALDTPVVSGNVSLYNETRGIPISPTPATVMIGLKNSLRMPYASIESLLQEYFKLSHSPNPVKDSAIDQDLLEALKKGGGKNLEDLLGVYLISSHQLFCNGLKGEMDNQEPKFYGSLKADTIKPFMDRLLKAVSLAPPLAIRVVGQFGLAYTLARMLVDRPLYSLAKGAGLKNKQALLVERGMEISTSYDPFQERLYECVAVLTPKAKREWQKVFGSSFKMEKLGVVVQSPHLLFNTESVLVSSLKKAYFSGWDKAFQKTSVGS